MAVSKRLCASVLQFQGMTTRILSVKTHSLLLPSQLLMNYVRTAEGGVELVEPRGSIARDSRAAILGSRLTVTVFVGWTGAAREKCY